MKSNNKQNVKNSLASVVPGASNKKASRVSIRLSSLESVVPISPTLDMDDLRYDPPGLIIEPPPPESPTVEHLEKTRSFHTEASYSTKKVAPPDHTPLDHLIWLHLRKLGLVESAEAFYKEGFVDDTSQVAQALSNISVSPLQSLLGTKQSTEQCIQRLLQDTPNKLVASAHHFFDRDTMTQLVDMALQPMWSPPTKIHFKTTTSTDTQLDVARMSLIRAASLNQLIERITKVVYQSNVRQELTDLESQFVQAFLRTYKHFCAPHTLLAKIFQRWSVPKGLPLTDGYYNHYIMMNTTKKSSSAKYWLSVSNKIKYRIASTILDWIREFPEDWDEVMIQTLEVFIDDNFYEPCPASPYGSTELLQFSEAIKTALANIVKARQAKPTVPEQRHLDPSRSRLTLLSDEITETVLATQLTAIDHENLRRINVRELLDFTKNEMHFLNLQVSNGVTQTGPALQHSVSAYVTDHPFPATPRSRAKHSGNERMTLASEDGRVGWAQGLSLFFQHAQDVQEWVVVELLATVDHHHRAMKMEKLIATAFKLLEMNNFQTCQSLVFAFKHPTIQRMKSFLSQVESIDKLDALMKVFADPTSSSQIKKLMNSVTEEDNEKNPPIPCLGVWVSDLQLIEEAEPTVMMDNGVGLIHWRKYQAVATIFTRFANIQNLVVPPTYYKSQVAYQFILESLERLENFRLATQGQLSETLMQISREREP
eukprot:TRINITY_DN9335_c0_g1_i1.p1 TRINITY_DN9335_c0_g1~~TRINITY_DN9335_c0_g1_i1.p1  ORF type:complete len:710 (+),score=211.39 TRINITY_DN9335_c0_g1_i1:21-2150(+)